MEPAELDAATEEATKHSSLTLTNPRDNVIVRSYQLRIAVTRGCPASITSDHLRSSLHVSLVTKLCFGLRPRNKKWIKKPGIGSLKLGT